MSRCSLNQMRSSAHRVRVRAKALTCCSSRSETPVKGRAAGLFSRSACEALDRASQLSLSYLANLRWRRSFFSIGFWGPEFVLFIFLVFRLIVPVNNDRFFFHDPRLQFLLVKNKLQSLFGGHISQFNAETIILD